MNILETICSNSVTYPNPVIFHAFMPTDKKFK